MDTSKAKTAQILSVMRILAWVAFFGFMVEAGAILISYGVSCINPEGAKNLYNGLNLYKLRQFNFWHYTLAVSFMVAMSLMKAYVSFMVASVLSKINMANPFKVEVAQTLEKISYVIFGTWFVAMLHNGHIGWLLKRTGELQTSFVSGEFIFLAGVVFIISQIFKRGIEIQSENELTV